MIPQLDATRPEWQEHAACRPYPKSMFFPNRGKDTRPAKKVCMTCTVRQECLEYSIGHDGGKQREAFGVWGGLSDRERRRLVTLRIRKARESQNLQPL